MQQKFDITGMTCSACSAAIEKNVKKIDGIEQVSVNLLGNNMTVTYQEDAVRDDAIIQAVEHAGYGAAVHGNEETGKGAAKASAVDQADVALGQMKKRVIISFLFMIPLFYLSMGHMMGWPIPAFFHRNEHAVTFAFTQFLLCLPIVMVNSKYFTGGFKALWHRSPNMDSLVAIGSTAAIVYGIYAIYKIGYGLGVQDVHLVHTYTMDLYFETSAMILALITFGKYLEARSKRKTSQAITKLMDLAPKTATVLRDGAEVEIPVEEMRVGDVFVVRPGQSVPVDGVILEGNTTIDESALTGESIPVEKQPGDPVTGAGINQSGFITCRAEKVGQDTALAQIIRLVEEASSSKAPIAKLADKVSGVFVPAVIVIALAATIIWLLLGKPFEFAMSIGIAVLVISCPCALGLATPTAIMVGTGKGAENGILIKSAPVLETAHQIDTIVLDKTGTITEGKPRVTDVIPLTGQRADDFLALAASMEVPSEHPLSKAIVERAKEKQLNLQKPESFEALNGLGIQAVIAENQYFAGNRKMMGEHGVDISAQADTEIRLAKEGKTPLYFAKDGVLIGMIAIADTIKPTSSAAVAEMRAMGIDVIMLTGDNQRTAKAIQQQVGITKVIAEVLPQDKESEVRRLQEQGHNVAMVGDGINDAPALTRADVGIAIGAGTDVAIESADIVLMRSDLLDVVSALQLSKATIKNIKENLFWALIYNAIGIPLAAGVFYAALGWKLNPMYGAAAMSLSSVCVVTNALRLKLFQPKFHRQGEQPTIQQGGITMEKTMNIEGMSCGHCSARVESALNAVDGVHASVDHTTGIAKLELQKDVADDTLKKAVTEAGYTVTNIQ